MSDKEIGLKVFQFLFKWNKSLYPKSFNYSFDVFLSKIQPDKKKLDIVLDGVGFGVRSADMSDSKIDSAMRKLALQGAGRIPKNPYDVFKFLSNESTQISWVDAAAYVATESAKDALKAAESVGNQVILTGKILNFLLPAIALFLVFVWINKASGGEALKAIKGFRK